jgi:hypothetical protein
VSVVGDVAGLVRQPVRLPRDGRRAALELTTREAAGRYEGLDDASLAAALTEDLHELCRDWHLRVRPRPPEQPDAGSDEDRETAWREQQRYANFGIARVEQLQGNVGLIELHGITDPAIGGRAIAAAMELVASTEALILDLRRNRGGAPQGVAMWCSYVFPNDETHLNDIYDTETGQTRQFWTWAHLPGERYPRSAGLGADERGHVLRRRGTGLQPQGAGPRHPRR